jgi:hypothetical protein|tara:strand:+ start:34 stop:501 length:468 start_codon:yes stop_codon:yes gene_type:complete
VGFLGKHKGRVLGRKTIPRSKIETGQMLQFRYKKVDKSGDADNKEVLAIVTGMYPYGGNFSVRKLHALSMDLVSDQHLRRLASVVGTGAIQEGQWELGERRGDPLKFYDVKLTKVGGLVDDAYRTYKMSNMTQVRVLTYDYSKILAVKFRGVSAE